MKRAVSISLGSSTRDKAVEITLLGEPIQLERIGTDGDMARAAQLFGQLDGRVDAFGVGGTDLALEVAGVRYPLHSIAGLVRHVHRTPVVDGAGLKHTLEAGLATYLDEALGERVRLRRALIVSGADRWGMATSFSEADYQCVFGDLMFGLGLPVPLRSLASLRRLGRVLIPVVSRLPFSWLYPTGVAQETSIPKWERYYRWATVIAGDCHYVKRHMPARLDGKVIVTNTTTELDVERFREAGVRHLVTSTPVVEGRSFGTNLMEAALVARAGSHQPLSRRELASLIQRAGWHPQHQPLHQ